MSDAIKDDTEKIIDDPSVKDDKDKTVDDPVDKVVDDKTKDKVVDAKSSLDKILEKHEFGSIDDLETALESGKTLQELIGNKDAVKLVRDAETLNKYESDWAKEDELKLQDEETPEESIKRLTGEVKEAKKVLSARDTADEDAKKTQQQVTKFEQVINSAVSKEDIPKEFDKFLGLFMGLKHPVNAIKLTDLAGAKDHAKSQVKLFREFEQVAIRRYIDGKAKIVDVKETDTTDTPVNKGAKVESLKDARKILQERVSNILKGK